MSRHGSEIGKCLSQMWEKEEEEEEHEKKEEEEEKEEKKEEEGQNIPALDNGDNASLVQRRGHFGIITMNQDHELERLTTSRATFVAPKSHNVRQKGIRGELMETLLAERIRERIQAEQNPPIPKTDFCSTSQREFRAEGFVPLSPESTQVHDYKTEEAITFWSENQQRVEVCLVVPRLRQCSIVVMMLLFVSRLKPYWTVLVLGVTAVDFLESPFRRSAFFTKQVGEWLDETMPPPDN
ncbi:sperm associated antigen 8 [Pleuronectes platessa]|uniref:sperm associated antigen 8 n=1 Tax=Pleuronectes platessa TaxID=8262 RepID=UPI00232A3FD7|nr:sperm associated antigen 8 [Pleuronectes platessa]